jgi:hypothetical protein
MLHCVPVSLSSRPTDNAKAPYDLFKVHLPGIREDSPKLQVGDRLLFRGLIEEYQAGTQEAVETEVVGIVKSQGMVYVRSEYLRVLDDMLPKYSIKKKGKNGKPDGQAFASKYQIQFYASAAPICAMQDAVSTSTSLFCGKLMNR